MATGKRELTVVRVAAMADIHYSKMSGGRLSELFAQVNQVADALVLAGDLTDFGLPEEAQLLAKDLTASLKIPVLAVLGNHDFESGKHEEVWSVLSEAGIELMDGGTCEVKGVGFAGVRGFGGGFDKYLLTPWGEPVVKSFVKEAVDEALKLEAALGKLMTEQSVAVLHYSPIRSTVEGEPPEIYAFTGCSRLEEPLNRKGVFAAVHGHAHHGSPEGRTSKDIPVYNVSMPVLQRAYPDRPPYCLLEIPVEA